MMKAGRVLNYFAMAGLTLAVSLLSACGSGNMSNGNSSSANAGTNSNANSAMSLPSPTPKIESFTPDQLIEALKNNRKEVDDRLASQEISISGAVKVVDSNNVAFFSKDGGQVNCSASNFDKAELQRLYELGSKPGSPPFATVTGSYHLSVPPDSKPNSHWYVGLRSCRIEAAGK